MVVAARRPVTTQKTNMIDSADSQTLDALVIGAGPAGIGTAIALGAVDRLTVGVVERGAIAETFSRWPEALTFLTPSFTGNGFGATDLNSVHHETSPAYSLGVDYPTGPEYARYLRGVARHFEVPVLSETEVLTVEVWDGLFSVDTTRGPVNSRTLVWAGGDYHDPLQPRFSGGSLVDHSTTADAWSPRGGAVAVIGGFESGIDIACHHVANGCDVLVVDPEHPWDAGTGSDPSFKLSPRTRRKLVSAQQAGGLTLISSGRVTAVRPTVGGGFELSIAGAPKVTSNSRPILATGFGPGLGPVAHLFDKRKDGWPLVNDNDESTIAPGLFLSGAALRHGGLKFCFVYKFRQRFAHVARVIGERLGQDCGALESWRTAGMLTDDLSCCGVECAC